METLELLQMICNIIILIGAAVGAIAGICQALGKPIEIFKKSRKQRRDAFVAEVKKAVDESLSPQLQRIEQQNIDQSHNIGVLAQASREAIGTWILDFYEKHEQACAVTVDEQITLKDLYVTYKNLDGNHQIDNIWKEIVQWKVFNAQGEIKNPDWTVEIKEENKIRPMNIQPAQKTPDGQK